MVRRLFSSPPEPALTASTEPLAFQDLILTLHRYWDRASCQSCALKPQCTPSLERRVTRWEHEAIIEALQRRMDLAPYAMRAAKQILNRTLQVDLASALELERSIINRMGSPEEIQEARREAAERSSTYANIFSKPDK